ncbi:MAG: NAD-dependent epimerase/dehydratase family protein [Vulcanisaeta sp. AZ3]|jgi:nucleoside-diphosphate-sugar epimerase
MEQVLIMGLGFIATNLAKHLTNRGFEVHVTYRSTNGSKALMIKDLMDLNVRLHKLDPGNYDEVLRLMNEIKPKYVFNTVGLLGGSWNELWQAHVEVPRNIARAIINTDKSIKFIHISASAAAGKIGNFIKEEPDHCNYTYVKPSGDYERSKCDGERAISGLGSEGLNYVIVRPTLVYGYYNDHDQFLTLYKAIKRGLVPIIRGYLNAIYVGYLVKLLESIAVNNEVKNTFLYATECTMYSLSDFSQLMANYLGVKGIKLPIPTGLISLFLPSSARGLLKYLGVQYSCEFMRKFIGDVEPAISIGVKEMVDWIKRVHG